MFNYVYMSLNIHKEICPIRCTKLLVSTCRKVRACLLVGASHFMRFAFATKIRVQSS